MDISNYKEHFITFLEAGFIAVNQADEDSAWKLFKAAELCNPKSQLPKIGFGYLHLHKLELKQAVETFDEVLKADPSNEMAKTFKGLCLSMTPDQADAGEQVLKNAADESHDPEVKKLATDAIDFVENFVKKAPSPVEAPKEKRKNP